MNPELTFSRARRRNSGFTLIELMVSTVCMTFLFIAVASMTQWMIKSWVIGAARVEISQQTVVILTRIGDDIRSALPILSQRSNIKFLGGNGGPPSGYTGLNNAVSGEDELRFHNVSYSSKEGSSSPDTGSDCVRTYFWLRNNSGKSNLVRDKRLSEGIYSATTSADRTVTPIDLTYGDNDFTALDRTATSFQVDYSKDRGATWQNTWDSDDERALPDLVRLKLALRKGTVTDTLAIVVRPQSRGTKVSLGI